VQHLNPAVQGPLDLSSQSTIAGTPVPVEPPQPYQALTIVLMGPTGPFCARLARAKAPCGLRTGGS
jgi:hypothetical protein